jgi:hypothetical protein
MPRLRMRSSADFQSRYTAYARDHGMTPEQIRDLDRSLYPYTILTPFFFWLNEKKLKWIRLHPKRTLQTGNDQLDFERWLAQTEPESNVLICECHGKYTWRN